MNVEYIINEEHSVASNIIYKKDATRTHHHLWSMLISKNRIDNVFENLYYEITKIAKESLAGVLYYQREAMMPIKALYENSEIIDFFPLVPSQEKTSLSIEKIIEWSHKDEFEAEIEVINKSGCSITFFATDYLENYRLYELGGEQNIYLSAIAQSVVRPLEVEKNYVALFGDLKEIDYLLKSYHKDKAFHAIFMGRVLAIQDFTFKNEPLKLLKVKVRIKGTKSEFFVLPVVVHKNHIKIEKLDVGDIIEGKVFLQGRVISD